MRKRNYNNIFLVVLMCILGLTGCSNDKPNNIIDTNENKVLACNKFSNDIFVSKIAYKNQSTDNIFIAAEEDMLENDIEEIIDMDDSEDNESSEINTETETNNINYEIIENTESNTVVNDIQESNNNKPNIVQEPTNEYVPTYTPTMSQNALNVGCILQNPELPTGCEVTALTIVLNYLGYNVDKCDLSDNYLDKGAIGYTNAYDAFIGEPRSEHAYGCYAPVIINCANKYLNESRNVINLTGTSFYNLFEEIDNGNPVIVWGTSYMDEPFYTTYWNLPGGSFRWKACEHCMVLTGYNYDTREVYISDPLVGNTSYNMDIFANRYESMFSQAIVIK